MTGEIGKPAGECGVLTDTGDFHESLGFHIFFKQRRSEQFNLVVVDLEELACGRIEIREIFFEIIDRERREGDVVGKID